VSNGHVGLGELRALSQAADVLIDRKNFAAIAGKTFGGERDLFRTGGYKRTLRFEDFRSRYCRNGLAKRIVDAPARATWRKFPELVDAPETGAETAFVRAWRDLARRLDLGKRFEQADRLAGLGEFAVLLLGVRDGRSLAEPLPSRLREARDLLFVRAFGEDCVCIHRRVRDRRDPRFGLPETYHLDLADVGERAVRTRTVPVHHSRVIHVAEDALEDDVRGTPRLQPVWNLLDDLDKVVISAGESAWLTHDRGIAIELDKDADLDKDNLEALDDEVKRYVHNLQRYLRLAGGRANVLGSEAIDPRGSFEVILSLIAGATGIPQRILLGSERGQLASSQDRANFADRIAERQVGFAEPCVLRPFVARAVDLGVLPPPQSDEFEVAWGGLDTLGLSELSGIMQRISRAAAGFAQATGRAPLAQSEWRRMFRLPEEKPDA